MDQIPNSETGDFEVFIYPGDADAAKPVWELWDTTETGNSVDRIDRDAEQPSTGSAAEEIPSTDRLAEELQRSFEEGREQGFRDGQAAEWEARDAEACSHKELRAELAAKIAEDFRLERKLYFEAVEQEVVKLALAIGARILRRETQADPLLLTGPVRVALGQLSASTQVRLLVPAAELELWQDTMAHLPNLAVRPTVVAAEEMLAGECRMESELGSVDLGIRAQLGEIERGFFDFTEGGSCLTAR